MEFTLGGSFYKQHQRFTERKKIVHLISSDEPSALDTNPILVHVLVSEIWKIKLQLQYLICFYFIQRLM